MKTVDFIITDGWMNTFSYIIKKIGRHIGPKLSETYFFKSDSQTSESVQLIDDQALKFKKICDSSTLRSYCYPRLRHVPLDKWFSAGSVCYLITKKKNVVSYCWAHYDIYTVEGMGKFKLLENEVWIGPLFVDKKYRRRGINQYQIKHILSDLYSQEIKQVFTSTNSMNHASIKSFVKTGFSLAAIFKRKSVFNYPVNRDLIEFNTNQSIEERIV